MLTGNAAVRINASTLSTSSVIISTFVLGTVHILDIWLRGNGNQTLRFSVLLHAVRQSSWHSTCVGKDVEKLSKGSGIQFQVMCKLSVFINRSKLY